MYCAYDKNENIVAYHESKDVVEEYIFMVNRDNNNQLSLGKIKKESLWKIENNDDLYLTCYKDSYVQSGYLLFHQLSDDGMDRDIEYAKNVICKILEFNNELKTKDIKKLKDAVKVLDKLEYEYKSYTPDLDALKRFKEDLEPYMYNMEKYDL